MVWSPPTAMASPLACEGWGVTDVEAAQLGLRPPQQPQLEGAVPANVLTRCLWQNNFQLESGVGNSPM